MLTLLASSVAWAAWPETVSILAMDDYSGIATEVDDDDYVATGYGQVVKELGVTLANKPMAPADTLGINGFAVQFGSTIGFIRTGSVDGTNPSGWDLADPDEDPQQVLYVPTVMLRKGLPASLEAGANFGWVGGTRTAVAGGYGRWSLVEGYRPIPDVTLQLGYAGYIGNDELELGVMDFSATVGYRLPFGSTALINTGAFSPYFGIGFNRMHAAPRVDLTGTGLAGDCTAADTADCTPRVGEVSGFEGDAGYDESYSPLAIGGGFRIESGGFTLTVAGTYAPGVIPTVSAALGSVY
jgi:hypothetical protein